MEREAVDLGTELARDDGDLARRPRAGDPLPVLDEARRAVGLVDVQDLLDLRV